MINGVYLDLIDIYLVITGFKRKSSNRKTGEMLQSYIIDKNSIDEKTVLVQNAKIVQWLISVMLKWIKLL